MRIKPKLARCLQAVASNRVMIARSEGLGFKEDGRLQNSEVVGRPVPICVWLVDDDAEYRTFVADYLSQSGRFECSQQFSSAEALLEALGRETLPEAILLDNHMGGMTGMEALRPIRAVAPKVRVVILTTFCDAQRKFWALSDGASDVLFKVSPLEEISDRLRIACKLPVPSVLDDIAQPREIISPLKERRRCETDWPERRAPETRDGRHQGDDMSQAQPNLGQRKGRWRSASLRLARGVRYLRVLFEAMF